MAGHRVQDRLSLASVDVTLYAAGACKFVNVYALDWFYKQSRKQRPQWALNSNTTQQA